MSEKIIKFIISIYDEVYGKWRMELTTGEEILAKVKIKSGIFQGDSL